MINSVEQFLDICGAVYGVRPVPRGFALLRAAYQVRAGSQIDEVTKEVRTTRRKLEEILASDRPLATSFGGSLGELSAQALSRSRSILGQLLLGNLAEQAFESIYRTEISTEDLVLEDDRQGRTDTDYRVLNGERRPVFRLNIKFHGTLFEKAFEMVGLRPDDCFALATYKIFQAREKERSEVLPYVFAVVTVPGLTSPVAAGAIPNQLIEFVGIVHESKLTGKRSVEERVVDYVLDPAMPPEVGDQIVKFADLIRSAPWRLISATKAEQLVKDLLFQRVFAVRVPRFARNYSNAELDMHFSLDNDLTPLGQFLEQVHAQGLHGVTAHLSRGLI